MDSHNFMCVNTGNESGAEIISKAMDMFRSQGIILIQKEDPHQNNDIAAASDAPHVVKSRQQEDKLVILKMAVLDLLAEYRAIAEGKEGGFGLKKENGFRELVQKDPGRFDINLDHLIKPSTVTDMRIKTEVEHQLVEIYYYMLERIRPYLTEILTDQFVANGFGAVISEPGVNAQQWHVDSSHLFEDVNATLPCHFVTVFAPLFEYSEEIGPTEIALGSHLHTWCLRNRVVEDQYPSDAIVEKLLSSENIRQVKLSANIGDIAIMDGKCLHRGSKNESECTRPLLYLSFARPFYYEWPRSHSDARSLFV
jgi:hypothetical protein